MRKAPARTLQNHHGKAITVSIRAGVSNGARRDKSESPRCLRLRQGPADKFFEHIRGQECPSCMAFVLALDRVAYASNNSRSMAPPRSLAPTILRVSGGLSTQDHIGNHRPKLDWQKVHKMRILYRAGCPQSQLAKTFGVGVNAVSKIVRNQRWIAPSNSVNGQMAESRQKLNWDKVREIRALYAEGEISQVQIAKRFAVSQNMISKIVRNKRWTTGKRPAGTERTAGSTRFTRS